MIYLEQHFVQNVNREMSITSFEEPFYLVEVLAFFLKYFEQILMRQLYKVNATHIHHWVIIVPVEFNKLIREAAGLVS